MKRGGISILFIHSYLWDLSYLLDHLLLFENVLCDDFESILKRRLRLGKHCNSSRLYKNVYKVLDLLKMFHVFESLFLKVFGVCFENKQGYLI